MQKAACSLTSKAAGVNGTVFPLSPAGSVPAEAVLWKLLCSRSLNTKAHFLGTERKIFPVTCTEELPYLLLGLQKPRRREHSPAQKQELLSLLLALVIITAGADIQQGRAAIAVLEQYFSSLLSFCGSILALDSLTHCISSLINCQLQFTALV